VSAHSCTASIKAKRAPSRASRMAAARPFPMPSAREPAPVTMAVRPASDRLAGAKFSLIAFPLLSLASVDLAGAIAPIAGPQLVLVGLAQRGQRQRVDEIDRLGRIHWTFRRPHGSLELVFACLGVSAQRHH